VTAAGIGVRVGTTRVGIGVRVAGAWVGPVSASLIGLTLGLTVGRMGASVELADRGVDDGRGVAARPPAAGVPELAAAAAFSEVVAVGSGGVGRCLD
jgi:hypothetical protein